MSLKLRKLPKKGWKKKPKLRKLLHQKKKILRLKQKLKKRPNLRLRQRKFPLRLKKLKKSLRRKNPKVPGR